MTITMKTERGFSLLEAAVATAIVSGALITLARVVLMSGAANAAARSITTATILATEKMEQLWRSPFSSDAIAGDDRPLNGEYVRRWSAEPLPLRPDDAAVIRVAVTHRSGRGDARLVTVRVRKAP